MEPRLSSSCGGFEPLDELQIHDGLGDFEMNDEDMLVATQIGPNNKGFKKKSGGPRGRGCV